MKILLDECVPRDLCKSFPDYECQAARQAGFGGKKNGELLVAAGLAGFDVLLTVDKNISCQYILRRFPSPPGAAAPRMTVVSSGIV